MAGFVIYVGVTGVAVFNIAGEFFAIKEVSTDDDGTLAGYALEGYETVCPRHGACCYLRSGKVTAPPA